MEQMNAGTDSLRQRELDVAREIAHAILTAGSALEVYRLALARVTPVVRASFSSVFQRDPEDPTLLKLTCAHNWPQSSARYLGELRLRVGRGPTGRAVADSRAVEVRDVFADGALRDWWEPARELGFMSLISLPLRVADATNGALTFYFEDVHDFADDERHLLRLVADQLAVAGARAASFDAVRRELKRLRAENAQLRDRVGADEEAKRLKDEFLSNISHELRTPLTSIMGYAGMLSTGEAGPLAEKQLHAVQRIESSAHVLLRLITDLLDLYQIKLGRTRPQPAPDDAVMIAQRALAAAGDAQPGVHVSLETSADRIPLVADGEKVTRILENLLTNAFKFTEQGAVTMRVIQRDDAGDAVVEWQVADTGIGIPAEKQEAIFDEFRQVDGSSTRLYGGTGLGLALSRALTRMLGGRLTVQSVEGAGSEFSLIVPIRTPSL
jgi:signal transduction histidine kinase